MINDVFEKKDYLNMLYDIYKELLTDKQKNYFELYFQNDLTFDEIADEFNISKAAVHDSITKTTNILIDYEKKLNIYKKDNSLKELCEKLNNKKITIDDFIKKIEEAF